MLTIHCYFLVLNWTLFIINWTLKIIYHKGINSRKLTTGIHKILSQLQSMGIGDQQLGPFFVQTKCWNILKWTFLAERPSQDRIQLMPFPGNLETNCETMMCYVLLDVCLGKWPIRLGGEHVRYAIVMLFQCILKMDKLLKGCGDSIYDMHENNFGFFKNPTIRGSICL